MATKEINAAEALPEYGERIIDPITSVTEDELKSELFLNEPVTIMIHDSVSENDLKIVTPSVNSINQPIQRGVHTIVKRKYVEALANGKQIRYTQRSDPREPDKIENVPHTSLSYPFSVIEDKNPIGAIWLRNLLSQGVA